MARFHFTTANGETHPDVEGTELQDLDAARVEGARLMGQLLRDHPDRFWEDAELRLRVYDDKGRHLFEIATVATPRLADGSPPLPLPPIGRRCESHK